MYFQQPPKDLHVDSTFLSEESKTKSTFDCLKGKAVVQNLLIVQMWAPVPIQQLQTVRNSVLDQESILDFLLGSDLNYEHFLGHYIFDLEALQ